LRRTKQRVPDILFFCKRRSAISADLTDANRWTCSAYQKKTLFKGDASQKTSALGVGSAAKRRFRNLLAGAEPEVFNVIMSDNIYKKIELVGSSPNGIEDAVNNAIDRAAKTIRNMGWFEVAEVRGHIVDNKVAHWQVTVKVGFTLDS
jgi:flavin-binding protein dodecin